MSTKLQTVSRLELVWDIYFADLSLKGSTRAKRGQGLRRRVVAAAAIPGKWQNFLRVVSNKTELFRFLSAALMEWFDQEDKQLVITDGEAVFSKPLLPDLTSLAPCNHEEADNRMLLHASHAVKHGHHSIVIRTVDTGAGSVRGTEVATRRRTMAGIWNRPKFPIPSSTRNSSWTGTREGSCTANVPRSNWMRHCVQFCQTWQEDCVGSLDGAARTH